MTSTAVTKTRDPIRQAIDKMAPEFRAALPAHVPIEKFVRVAMTAINSDPGLRQADRNSLFGAVTKLAQDGLLPDGREAALVIFNTKQNGEWVKKVQAMPMVSGLLKMMRQSGEVAWIDAQVVRQGDHFQYRPGLDEMPIFEPDWFGKRGGVVGVYAIAKLKSGEIVPPEIMSLEQIEQVRDVSKAKDKGPWVDWFDQMALKTVLRRYMKRLPTSTDVLSAFDRDETMATTIGPVRLTASPETQASNVTRLDALEHKIDDEPEYDGNQDDPFGEQEGGATEESAEEAPPSFDEQPAWADKVTAVKADIDECTNLKDLDALEKGFDLHSAALPDDVSANVRQHIDIMRKALRRREG